MIAAGRWKIYLSTTWETLCKISLGWEGLKRKILKLEIKFTNNSIRSNMSGLTDLYLKLKAKIPIDVLATFLDAQNFNFDSALNKVKANNS